MYVPDVAMSLKQSCQGELLANVGKMKQAQPAWIGFDLKQICI